MRVSAVDKMTSFFSWDWLSTEIIYRHRSELEAEVR